MKLLASIGNKYCVFSVGHHDYVKAPDGTMADGGQPGLPGDAGYRRSSGKMAWVELPGITFADLINDYELSEGSRRYGVHELGEVSILSEGEIPDFDSFEWKAENATWGSRGKNGKQKLKYSLIKDLEIDHLKNILLTQRVSDGLEKIISYWISKKEDDLKKRDSNLPVGWICPICGLGVSPFLTICPCSSGFKKDDFYIGDIFPNPYEVTCISSLDLR